MATLDDVWQAALIRLGLPEDDGYLNDPAVKRTIVSKAQRDVASRVDWPELAAEATFTVASDPPFDLDGAENLLRIQWVAIEHDTSTDLLQPRQRRDLLGSDHVTASERGARYYTVVSDGLGGRKLWISPPPAVGVDVRYSYVRKPADVLNDTDPILIADHMIEAVELRVVWYMAMRKGDIERAQAFNAEYQDTLRWLNDEALVSRGPLLPRTRQDW